MMRPLHTDTGTCTSTLNSAVPGCFQAVFEGTTAKGIKGDIAIDDVKLVTGACQAPGDCNFEQGMCTWTQYSKVYKGDDFDWLRARGSTPSTYTGPVYDHTRGDSDGKQGYLDKGALSVLHGVKTLMS